MEEMKQKKWDDEIGVTTKWGNASCLCRWERKTVDGDCFISLINGVGRVHVIIRPITPTCQSVRPHK